jgi:hypothetical protein
MDIDPTAHSLSNRIVLLGLTDLALEDETPAHAPQIRQCCQDCANHLPDVVAGTFDEATVARSLNELEAGDVVVANETDQPSAVGKGRPAFDLATDADRVLDALATDDAVAPAVDAIRE